MKKHILVLYFLIFSGFLSANDGAYLSGGGTIYPVKESNISMEKEILSFQVIDRQCYVTIHFEFLNPGKESKKLLVGFQAPQAVGDVTEDEINPAFFRN